MAPARVTVVDATALQRLRTRHLRDAIADAGPDAIAALSPGARNRLRTSPAVPDELPIVLVWDGPPSNGTRTRSAGLEVHRLGGVDLLAPAGDEELAEIPALVAAGRIDSDAETYVLTDRLSLSVRPTALRTELVGLEDYVATLAGGDAVGSDVDGDGDANADVGDGDAGALPLEAPVTHVSTSLPPDYYADVDLNEVDAGPNDVGGTLTLRGAAPTGDDALDVGVGTGGDGPAVLTLVLGAEGTVATRSRSADDLGLRAIRGVGDARGDALRSAGIETREQLAHAEPAQLADLDSLDRTTALRLREHAAAHVEGRVLRRSDETLPDAEPVFVDVETDGLSPSIVWLVGVLDRSGGGDDAGESEREKTYMSFLARDPADPGAALDAFCSWLFANASNRPVVAYNGLSFDFPVIEEHVERHYPRHLDDWRSQWRFDPYQWAVGDGNAVLPGRTNSLEDVAAALGHESATDDPGSSDRAPLSGGEVARIYRRWMRACEDREEGASGDPGDEPSDGSADAVEPDWARLEAYCEDDVRALAHVYDAIADAARHETADAGRTGAGDGRPTADRTTQGSLGDF